MLLVPDQALKKNNFDFTRFILAALVVFTHSFLLYFGDINKEPLNLLSKNQIGFGSLAVLFFFLISGFLILQSWSNSRGRIDYLLKRILRIMPAFVIVSILCLVVFGPMGIASNNFSSDTFVSYWKRADLFKFTSGIFLMQRPVVPETLTTVPYPSAINDPIWTIRYEFICYLIIPVLSFIGFYRKKILPLMLFVIVFSIFSAHLIFNLYGIPFIGNELLEICLTHFMAGSLFFYYRAYIFRSLGLLVVSICFLIAATIWLNVLHWASPIFGGYCLFYFIFSTKPRFKNFAKYGDFSYGIYLYSWPVQQLIVLYFFSYLTLATYFFLSLGTSIIFAFASWHLIEKPALSLKKRLSFINKRTIGYKMRYIFR